MILGILCVEDLLELMCRRVMSAVMEEVEFFDGYCCWQLLESRGDASWELECLISEEDQETLLATLFSGTLTVKRRRIDHRNVERAIRGGFCYDSHGRSVHKYS